MPDAIGFTLATAFLATVFTVFGIIGRIVDGVVSEIRLTVAPAMVDGVRAWGDELAAIRGRRASSEDGAPADRAGEAPDGGSGGGRREPGLVVPVQRVPGRGWHLFAAVMRRRLA